MTSLHDLLASHAAFNHTPTVTSGVPPARPEAPGHSGNIHQYRTPTGIQAQDLLTIKKTARAAFLGTDQDWGFGDQLNITFQNFNEVSQSVKDENDGEWIIIDLALGTVVRLINTSPILKLWIKLPDRAWFPPDNMASTEPQDDDGSSALAYGFTLLITRRLDGTSPAQFGQPATSQPSSPQKLLLKGDAPILSKIRDDQQYSTFIALGGSVPDQSSTYDDMDIYVFWTPDEGTRWFIFPSGIGYSELPSDSQSQFGDVTESL